MGVDVTQATKRCAECGNEKSLTDFHADKRKTDGRRSRCKACTCADQRKFQQEYKARTGAYATRKYRYACVCKECGTDWSATRSDAKYCSPACQAAAMYGDLHAARAHQQAVIRREKAASRLRVAASGTRGAVVFTAGHCGSCGDYFVGRHAQMRWCSVECKRRQNTARRRARERDAFVADVSPHKIFERDHWECQLCGGSTDRAKAVPHPQAPVLDHVLPLARGGTHEPANVQCAHFVCNSVKGDRLDIELIVPMAG